MKTFTAVRATKPNPEGVDWEDWMCAAGADMWSFPLYPYAKDMRRDTKIGPLYRAWLAGEDPTEHHPRAKHA